jgi:hypothetical protein
LGILRHFMDAHCSDKEFRPEIRSASRVLMSGPDPRSRHLLVYMVVRWQEWLPFRSPSSVKLHQISISITRFLPVSVAYCEPQGIVLPFSVFWGHMGRGRTYTTPYAVYYSGGSLENLCHHQKMVVVRSHEAPLLSQT